MMSFWCCGVCYPNYCDDVFVVLLVKVVFDMVISFLVLAMYDVFNVMVSF